MTPEVKKFGYDSAMGLSLVLEKPKSVYVIPPLTKHLAGQHDQTSHGSWATGIAGKISEKTAGLKKQGVTQEFLTGMSSIKEKKKIYQNLEEIARSMYALTDEEEEYAIEEILQTEGFQMTSKALEFESDRAGHYDDGDSYTSVLRTSSGDVAGAIAVAIEANDNGEPVTEMHYLGTTGIVDGAGSMLYGQAINYAYQNKTGLQLYPLREAIPFWKSMGFKETAPEYLGISFEEVESIWKELTTVESAMPSA